MVLACSISAPTLVVLLSQIALGAGLEVSPNSESFLVLRRNQAKLDHNLFSQNFPQSMAYGTSHFSLGKLSAYDSYFLANTFPWNQKALFNWQDPNGIRQFRFSALARIVGGKDQSANVFGKSLQTAIGFRIYGQINPSLRFFSQGEVYREETDSNQFLHQFDPDFGETCATEQTGTVKQKSRTCARYTSYLLWDVSWAQFKVGRDHLHMGPGYFSSLMFTKNTPPYYLVNMRIPFSDWLYVDNYIVKMVDSDHSIEKYAHVHRFEFKPTKSLSIAFQDMVLYSGRSVDYQYALPLTPLLFVEDNTGGRDNDALGIDVMYSGLPYVSLWGELFIDDLLSPTSFFDDFWENRWAALAGVQVVSPWETFDGDVVIEASRVEPWTYLGRSSTTSFRHFNVPSASKLGPDSWTLDIQVSYRPWKHLEWVEYLEFSEKGTQDGAVLGSVHNNEQHGTTKKFLDGNTIRNNKWSHEFKYQYLSYLTGSIGFTQDLSDWGISGYWLEVNMEW
jgi:hypothetical protein